jgi:biopolymer transport protein ExbD
MRFRAQQRHNAMPEVNLVPMMDVIMTILTFFIILSMTMTTNNISSVDIRLPGRGDGKSSSASSAQSLIVGLNLKRQILLESGVVDRAQLIAQVNDYLAKNPQGVVILKADKEVPYEQVVQVLGVLRDVGGDRVSLAIQ